MSQTFYKNKKALITGGLGFIGSNIAHSLVSAGSRVVILDTSNSMYGGNKANLVGIEDKVEVIPGDIRDEKLIPNLIKDKDLIFNLAAQVSPVDSGKMPYEDLDVNCRGHLNVLEAMRQHNPEAKIFLSSSRFVLGKSDGGIVTEETRPKPVNLYGIHKLTSENYYRLYAQNFGLKTFIFRITNPYGERQQMKHDKYSLPGWFMRKAIQGETINIFGDGSQLRDYIYIGDLVEAILAIMEKGSSFGEIYNCGSGESRPFREMVETIIKTVGSGRIEFVPWPKEYTQIESGDSLVDITKLKKATDWEPKTAFRDGIKRMVHFFKENIKNYI